MGPEERQIQLIPDEQRTVRRRRVLLAGRLVYGDAHLTQDCAIRDLSEGGARIRLSSPVPLPAQVWLIEVRSATAFCCEVAWRRAPEFGLRFLERHDLTTETAPELKPLKRIWIESAAR
jgi:two-component system cell cycle response regulator